MYKIVRSVSAACFVAVILVLAGCGEPSPAAPPSGSVDAPVPLTAEPQVLFDRWKVLVANPNVGNNRNEMYAIATQLTNRAPEYIDKMIDVLLDPATSQEGRFAVLDSIRLGLQPQLYPRLLTLTEPGVDPAIRAQVIIVLANTGDPAVAERLKQLKDDPERRVRLAALCALTESGDADARQVLREYYGTEGLPAPYRGRMVESLALMPESGDLPVFVAAVREDGLDVTARIMAVGALGRLADTQALPALEAVAASNAPAELKEIAASAANNIRAVQGQSSGPLGAAAAGTAGAQGTSTAPVEASPTETEPATEGTPAGGTGSS